MKKKTIVDLTPEIEVDVSVRLHHTASESSSLGTLQDVKSADSQAIQGPLSTRAIFSRFDVFAKRVFKNLQEAIDHQDDEVDDTVPVSSSLTLLEDLTPEYLSELEAVAVGVVLEDAVDQLNILGAKRDDVPHMEYQNLEDRFRPDATRPAIIDTVTDKPMHLALNESRVNKLLRDASFVENVLSLTLDELRTNGSIKTLIQLVGQDIFVREEEDELLEEARTNSEEVKALMKELKDEKAECSNKLQELDEVIANLKDEFQECYFKSQMKIKFVNVWEKTRREQNTLKGTITQKERQEQVDNNVFSFDVETRVHAEIEDFIRLSQTRFEEEIELWMERYDQEMDERDGELNRLKQDRAEHYKKFEDLALQYQHHKNEMEEYMVVREERERRLAMELFLYNMATRIQAWWRGMMVRQHLGPFRKKGKGKGKDKGKGAKKGKK